MVLSTRPSRLGTLGVFVGISATLGILCMGCSPSPVPEEPVVESEESPVVPTTEPEEPAAQVTPQPEQPVAEPADENETPAVETAPEPEQPVAEPQPQPTEPAVEPAPESGAAPKVSAFAPAKDLEGQVDDYVKELEESVQSEADYNDSVEKLAKDSNTLIVIALALGLHDEDNKYKASAGAMMKAAQDAAAAAEFAAARAAVAAVKAAASGQTTSNIKLKWEKVASLPELMKQVPLINTKLKRYVKRKRPDDCAGFAAVIAVIAQGTMANAGDTDEPEEVEKWQQFSVQMREAAAEVIGAVRGGDADATSAAMQRLQQSCDDCHAVFHPEETQ